MKVLITGIAGHIPSRLAQWILDNIPDCEVYGVDDHTCGYFENIPEKATYEVLSLGDTWTVRPLEEMFQEVGPFDYVFHMAAYAAEGLSPFIREYNYKNNLMATAEVVNCCLRHPPKRLVFTSSMAVYGKGTPPFTEDDPCNPIDPYGIAKRACELDIMQAGEQHGLQWTIIRPHNFYGPYQSIWQKYRNVFGIWMSRILEDKPLLIFGDGTQTRAFSYIQDALPCFWTAATSAQTQGEIINLGGIHACSIREAAESLMRITGYDRVEYADQRHEAHQAYTTYEKSVDLLGFEHKTHLERGLTEMWTWAQRAWELYPERREHFLPEIEVSKGLYKQWQ